VPIIACVNGRVVPIERATVSVEDRGFQFGDGVYEVVRSYHGVLFHLDEHLDRLEQSAKAIRLPLRHSRSHWRRLIQRAYALSRFPEAKVYVQVTRGPSPRDHRFPTHVRPTTVITVRRLEALPWTTRERGVSAVTVPDLRWGRCDVKSVNLLANVLAKEDARAAGAFEAILVRDGVVTEGAVSNCFSVIDGTVVTSPTDPSILPGITRALTADLIRREGIPFRERPVMVDEYRRADEIFLTGTTIEILSVVSLDGRRVGTGSPGKIARRLYDRFMSAVAAECGPAPASRPPGRRRSSRGGDSTRRPVDRLRRRGGL